MMDENEIKSPIKRLGSTRKLMVFNNIRLQLNEQVRCLDARMETQCAIVGELQDFFRRRGELEMDYSKNLEKMVKSLQIRHKEQKQKRENWSLFSSYSCWQELIDQTKNLSRDHGILSEIYTSQIVQRLHQVVEDIQRVYKKCKDISTEMHEEILQLLHELHQMMKTYHVLQNASKALEAKLSTVENQSLKCEMTMSPEKWATSKKQKWFTKEIGKRRTKYRDARVKELKARNEYLLCLEAANVTIQKFFGDDMSDLIDCMDIGFANCISRAIKMFISAEVGRSQSVKLSMDCLQASVHALNSRVDKQKFLEAHNQAFMIPKKIEFQGQREESTQELAHILNPEMSQRQSQLQIRIQNLKLESDEIWKTVDSTETTLREIVNAKDFDCTPYFGLVENKNSSSEAPTYVLSSKPSPINLPSTSNSVNGHKTGEVTVFKARPDRPEIEEFYVTKFHEYLLSTSRIARLEAKQMMIEQQLKGFDGVDALVDVWGFARAEKRKRIGRMDNRSDIKLFGGSLEEFVEKTGDEIPLIIRSCIRVINLFGLHHQGIFRVSGSQLEINNFRDAFERGEDPLADMTDASDINSVAGVLKLYLRELREPLFPILYFDQLMAIAQISRKEVFVIKIREVIAGLPRAVRIVMRYLFAFLHHLSDYSEENMMDPYNIAICFGPTLVPVPEDKDQVQYQNQVNDLIKNIITYNEEIFPNDGGCVYEKFLSDEVDENYAEDLKMAEDGDSEVFLYGSEDDSESIEAVARYDYDARSDKELSITRGDSVTLFEQVSDDWWNGHVNGKSGLVPDMYLTIDGRNPKIDRSQKCDTQAGPSGEQQPAQCKKAQIEQEPIDVKVIVEVGPMVAMITPPDDSGSFSYSEGNSSDMEQAKPREKFGYESPRPSAKGIPYIDSQLESQHKTHPKSTDLSKNVTRSTSPSSDTDSVEIRNPQQSIKKHWKSQSVGEISTEDDGNVSFSQNRELWQKRASCQSVKVSTPPPTVGPALVVNRHSESWVQRQKHTPDLVMDLPLAGNSSLREQDVSTSTTDGDDVPVNIDAAIGPESPDMSTAAERFAKQNQCTLKKNTKVQMTETIVQAEAQTEYNETRSPVPTRTHKFAAKFADMHLTGSFKPQVMTKPQVLRKPVLPITISTTASSGVPSTSPDVPPTNK